MVTRALCIPINISILSLSKTLNLESNVNLVRMKLKIEKVIMEKISTFNYTLRNFWDVFKILKKLSGNFMTFFSFFPAWHLIILLSLILLLLLPLFVSFITTGNHHKSKWSLSPFFFLLFSFYSLSHTYTHVNSHIGITLLFFLHRPCFFFLMYI